ncbi:putative odorant receptor 85d [Aricia agestis]|uniref:putative odorant receptor 85d n=1 Tax=Aricia agestis TaxID=91739 RepID=UPI001C206AA3|nr:putative odorant receptor 85d [Aricia agestis]
MESLSFDEIFSQIKRNFYLLGIPLGKKPRFRYYISVMIVFMTIVHESLFFFSKFSRENFLELTQLAPCLSIGILATIKIVLIANKGNNILELANSLKTLYNDATNNEGKNQILREEMIFLRYLVKYFFMLNAILICVYNFSPFFIFAYYYFCKHEQVWRLPYAVIVGVSTESWYGWLYAYFHSTTSGFIVVLYFTTVDALYFILTTHTYCQFSLLSAEITQLNEENSYLLNNIVKKHQHILHLAKKLEKIFEGPNLFNVLIGSLEICALGFNVVMGDWAQLPGVMLFLSSVLVQILMISVFGEKLMQESMKIGDAAFLSQWYKMDRRSRRTILLLIVRAQRPCVLTAYNYCVISYQSFTKIISTSWSYFTLLKTVYSSERF